MNPNAELIRASVHDAVIRAVTEISADAKGLLEDALARAVSYTHLDVYKRQPLSGRPDSVLEFFQLP